MFFWGLVNLQIDYLTSFKIKTTIKFDGVWGLVNLQIDYLTSFKIKTPIKFDGVWGLVNLQIDYLTSSTNQSNLLMISNQINDNCFLGAFVQLCSLFSSYVGLDRQVYQVLSTLILIKYQSASLIGYILLLLLY